MQDREQAIRARAHQIWESEGCPQGRDQEHWERAMKEVDQKNADDVPLVGSELAGNSNGAAKGEPGSAAHRSSAQSSSSKAT